MLDNTMQHEWMYDSLQPIAIPLYWKVVNMMNSEGSLQVNIRLCVMQSKNNVMVSLRKISNMHFNIGIKDT